MPTISHQALVFFYQLLEAVEENDLERGGDIAKALEEHRHKTAGEFLHLMANIANMLAKEHKQFFRLKGKILSALCRFGDGSVQLFADHEEGVVFLVSAAYGVTMFHHQPAQLEKATGFTFVDAPFRWSGFKRQVMALDEALDPKLLRANIKKSRPLPL